LFKNAKTAAVKRLSCFRHAVLHMDCAYTVVLDLISILIYVKWSNISVHHFSYCQWRISWGRGSSRIFKTSVS